MCVCVCDLFSPSPAFACVCQNAADLCYKRGAIDCLGGGKKSIKRNVSCSFPSCPSSGSLQRTSRYIVVNHTVREPTGGNIQ